MNLFLRFIIILAALAGFLLSFYIFKKKKFNEKLVCPIGSDCNLVVNSDYSKFFGIPLEFFGITYYGTIIAAYSLMTASSFFGTPTSAFLLIMMATAAFLFSVYLATIQAIVLKQWCTWCLSSTFLSTLIFAASLAASDWSFLNVLYFNQGLIFLIHLSGIALAIGAATVADIFFLRFLKDYKISVSESEILKTFGQVLWFALSIVVLSSFALYLPNSDIAWMSPQFATEMFVLTVIILNAVYLTLIVYPRFITLSFDRESMESKDEDRAKKFAFASGGVSIVSWYTMLFLVSPLPITLSTPRLFLVYAGIVLIAVGVSQIIHNHIEARAIKAGY